MIPASFLPLMQTMPLLMRIYVWLQCVFIHRKLHGTGRMALLQLNAHTGKVRVLFMGDIEPGKTLYTYTPPAIPAWERAALAVHPQSDPQMTVCRPVGLGKLILPFGSPNPVRLDPG